MFPLETAAPPQAPYTSWRPESRLGFSAADEARSRPEVGSRLIPGPGPSLPQLSSEPEQVVFTFFSLLILLFNPYTMFSKFIECMLNNCVLKEEGVEIFTLLVRKGACTVHGDLMWV